MGGLRLAKFVQVIIEDRLPGEEVKLAFTAEQRVLEQFLSALTDAGNKYLCRDTIPGILTECRLTRDRGVLKLMGANGRRAPESPG